MGLECVFNCEALACFPPFCFFVFFPKTMQHKFVCGCVWSVFNYKALACFDLFHFFVFFPNNSAQVCVCEVCRITYINLCDDLMVCVCVCAHECVKCAELCI